jgi:hypothetical protein
LNQNWAEKVEFWVANNKGKGNSDFQNQDFQAHGNQNCAQDKI